MPFGNNSTFGFANLGGSGQGGPSVLTAQFMWRINGPANFGSPPAAGATVFTNALLAGKNVIISRGGLLQMGLNPTNGDTYYTKNLADNFVTFSTAMADGEEFIVNVL